MIHPNYKLPWVEKESCFLICLLCLPQGCKLQYKLVFPLSRFFPPFLPSFSECVRLFLSLILFLLFHCSIHPFHPSIRPRRAIFKWILAFLFSAAAVVSSPPLLRQSDTIYFQVLFCIWLGTRRKFPLSFQQEEEKEEKRGRKSRMFYKHTHSRTPRKKKKINGLMKGRGK